MTSALSADPLNSCDAGILSRSPEEIHWLDSCPRFETSSTWPRHTFCHRMHAWALHREIHHGRGQCGAALLRLLIQESSPTAVCRTTTSRASEAAAGSEERCDGCGETVTAGQTVMGNLDAAACGLRLHVACFHVWDVERQASGREPSVRLPARSAFRQPGARPNRPPGATRAGSPSGRLRVPMRPEVGWARRDAGRHRRRRSCGASGASGRAPSRSRSSAASRRGGRTPSSNWGSGSHTGSPWRWP